MVSYNSIREINKFPSSVSHYLPLATSRKHNIMEKDSIQQNKPEHNAMADNSKMEDNNNNMVHDSLKSSLDNLIAAVKGMVVNVKHFD